uniref:Uncharacterized protein n=1 Tax=viral metagenome TaxID=1070528 RepID=A0A6M3J1Q5_9ZZZZ
MPEDKNIPQVTGEVEEKLSGTTESQIVESTTEAEPGAVSEPREGVTPEVPKGEKPKGQTRTYTQDEWAKRESALNKQSAELQKRLAQTSMELEIQRQTSLETTQRAKDLKEVEDGVISQTEAEGRQRMRESQKQQNQVLYQQSTTLRQMAQQAEDIGRILAAQDFGKKYELTPEQTNELLSNTDIKSPAEMEARAANLALDKVKGEVQKNKEAPEHFDKGQVGTAGKGAPSDEQILKQRYPTMFKK